MTNNDQSTGELRETVQFTLGLDTIVGTDLEYDIDGDLIGRGSITLGEMVARIVADNITRQITSEMRREFVTPVRARVDALADQLVEEKLREVLDRETVPTDPYGTAKGDPTSLAEVIANRAEAWLRATGNRNDYGRGGKTNMQHLIDEAVGRGFERELQDAVKGAKAAAVKAVADNAGAAMADLLRAAAVKS